MDKLELSNQMEDFLKAIEENQPAEVIIQELYDVLEDNELNDTEYLVALLALPDEIFNLVAEPFIIELERKLNDPAGRLNTMLALKKEGIDIEAFLQDLTVSLKEITDSDISETKKFFLQRLVMTFANAITASADVARKNISIPIELCHPDAKMPTYANLTDAGMDVYAIEEVVINPGETALIKTGIKVAIPEGYEIQVRPKSGISLKTKLRVANTPGTIDTGYRDEIGVILENTEQPIQDITYHYGGTPPTLIIDSILHGKPYVIEKGQKVAQLVLCEVPKITFQEVKNIGEIAGDRGGGFGSTGLK